jgi:parallel beta-helix repeat protein
MNRDTIVRYFISVIIVLSLIGSSFIVSAYSLKRPMVVCTSQTWYVGGSGPGNFTTIQDAINSSSDGDTVFVYDDHAPYYEDVVINVSIHLLGENRNTTMIEGGTFTVSILVDGVTVSGFRISCAGDFWNCCGFHVLSDGNTISRNNIMNNHRMNGVFLDRASYNTVSGNLIENNQFHGIRVEYASHNIIQENMIVKNKGYGIYLYEVQDSTIVGNTVRDSFFDGIMLGGYCCNNQLYHNNFIDNPGNANDVTGNIWDNGSSGNYWSDYTGADGNGDGIGDTPYLIPGNMSQDRFPLMEPFKNHPVDVAITITGGVGLMVVVRNQGIDDFLQVPWQTHLTGGLLLRPLTRDAQGSIQYLGSDEELTLQRIKPLIGVGFVECSVTVGEVTTIQRGLLLFLLFLPLDT